MLHPKSVLLLLLIAVLFTAFIAYLFLLSPRELSAQKPASLVSASIASTEALGLNDVPASCPITQPQIPHLTPPPPWPANAPSGEFWFGTESLWTSLPADSGWWGLPHNPEGYTQKIAFWKKGYDGRQEPNPQLTVTGKRLDGSAPSVVASRATNAYTPDYNWAMLVGIDLPTLGCWQTTAESQGHELSFVVWVAP